MLIRLFAVRCPELRIDFGFRPCVASFDVRTKAKLVQKKENL